MKKYSKLIKTAILSLSLFIIGCSNNENNVLHVYNWSDYISPELIQRFEAKYDCKVVIDTFDSNESMYAKLKLGASGYDVIVPSSYQVEMMSREGMLEKLDYIKLQNVKDNFDHEYDSQIIDTNLTYSVPYSVTYTGFLYNKDKIDFKNGCSWSILEGNDNLKTRITLLDDMREVIGAGLMYNGYSLNSTNTHEINKAVKTVIKWKENIRKFDSESYRTEVPNGSVYLGHGYSSDSSQIIIGDEESGVSPREDLGFILPKEGFTIAFDELAILSSSLKKDLAYKFIDFIYETDNAVENMEYICGLTPHKEALKKIDESLKNVIIPDNETMKNGQVLKSFVDRPDIQEIYNSSWDEIRKIR